MMLSSEPDTDFATLIVRPLILRLFGVGVESEPRY